MSTATVLKEKGIKASRLAKAELPKFETEAEVKAAIADGNVATIALEWGEEGHVPTGIDYPEGKDPKDCLVLIGYPIAGIQQELSELTLKDGSVVKFERVGSYAPGSCGAYRVVQPEAKAEPKGAK